jgi:hypothetical protein
MYITIKIVHIIHPDCPPHLKHSVSETGFCLRIQVELTQLGPKDIVSLSPRH